MRHHFPAHTHLQLFLRRRRCDVAPGWVRVAGHGAFAAALSLGAHDAFAQYFDGLSVSGSATVQSEYRYRGQALSDGKAVAQAGLNLDTASGAYVGLFASGATIAERNGAQAMAFAGYAQRLEGGASRELGCVRTLYTQWHVGDYGECYVGASGSTLSARLYYAPHYQGRAARTLYGELNYFHALHPRLNLVGHAGLLHTLAGAPAAGIPAGSRYDLRLGASVPFENWALQLARVLSQADDAHYPHYAPGPAQAWVLSASYAF